MRSGPDGLSVELQPARWALRLVDDADVRALSALCVVRNPAGRWLAGRRAAWVSSWAGRWALGAGGAVDVGESPTATLTRELHEEWSLQATELTIEALVRRPGGMAFLVGTALVAADSEPVPDAEHDDWAWWPAAVEDWPEEADEPLRLMASMLSGDDE
ncbi:MAG: NUDIX hydrolase [Solirubrobacterales bacterium]